MRRRRSCSPELVSYPRRRTSRGNVAGAWALLIQDNDGAAPEYGVLLPAKLRSRPLASFAHRPFNSRHGLPAQVAICSCDRQWLGAARAGRPGALLGVKAQEGSSCIGLELDFFCAIRAPLLGVRAQQERSSCIGLGLDLFCCNTGYMQSTWQSKLVSAGSQVPGMYTCQNTW